MDLDLDDLGLGDGPSQPASRPSRFIPKSSKLKPKPKSEPESEIVKDSETIILPKKLEDIKPVFDTTVKNDTKMEDVSKPEEEQLKEEVEADEVEAVPMDVDIDDDPVVREIDVFFKPSPIDSDTQLYVLQYPLRSCWRPYEMDQKCQEVRVKPKSVQVEIDLSLDIDTNYDEDIKDIHLKIKKQTLLSQKVPLKTGYAVGVLVGNKLHLNPVNAVVQLRPSMEHVKPGGPKKKNSATQNVGTKVKSEKTAVEADPSMTHGKSAKLSSEHDTDADESWISLEYHSIESIFSSRFRQKMTAEETTAIQFSMGPYDYVTSLCPAIPTEDNRTKGFLRRLCVSLPLEEKFKKWFIEGDQVNRFNALKYLAPDDSDEAVLGEIQRHAELVRGLWVCKSSLLQLQGREALVRDYLLLNFRKNEVIRDKMLEESGLPLQLLRRVALSLAFSRSTLKDWKFKVPKDVSFIKDHPEIVAEQEKLWGIREKRIMENLPKNSSLRNIIRPSTATKPAASGNADQGAKRSVDGTPKTVTMSDETREALPKALEDLFRRHKVCSLQLIRQGLRDLAISKSAIPKLQPKAVRAAALSADAPPSELQSFISQVATNIHGVYVSNSSENPTLNPLRDVVIRLFSAKEPNAKLKKAEITEAAKIALKRDITTAEYTQVITELCVSVKGNSWVLKSGDGSVK